MAIVDSLSSPADGTTYNANADCHIIVVFTAESGKNVFTHIRYQNPNDTVQIQARGDGNDSLVLLYKDGSTNEVARVDDVFTSIKEYAIDIYATGTNIIVDVDDVEKINETVSHNEAEAGGRIDNTLDTNDIELESWPYGEPADDVEVVQSPLGTLEITGFNPSVRVAVGDWEIGAYIYTAIGGVDVNVTLGTLSITGFNPIVTAFSGVSAVGFDRTAIRTVHLVH